MTAARAVELLAESDALVAERGRLGLERFRESALGEWVAFVDPRNGQVGFVEGAGLPWIPGFGNTLRPEEIGAPLASDGAITLATLEALARHSSPSTASSSASIPAELRLSPGRSGNPAPHLWLVDFDLVRGGLPVEGARVVFRVNNGNLIQFGSENLPARDVAVPDLRVTREQAYAIVRDYVGNLDPAWDELVDAGSEHLLPVAPALERAGIDSPSAPATSCCESGSSSSGAMECVGTWRARVDAASGEIVDFRDVNDYVTARVSGGVHLGDGLPPDTVLAMPFANVSSGGFTDSAGRVRLHLGHGDLDAQRAVRAHRRHLRRHLAELGGGRQHPLRELDRHRLHDARLRRRRQHPRLPHPVLPRQPRQGDRRGWLPANAWLNAQLPVNVNLNQTCNAYWNGSTLNFFHKGAGGCGNTGELPGVSLHEWGHGMDTNDGNGSSPENGTGETYGDFSAALSTHDSCIGGGFLTGNCGGYGNACTSCTGVRDMDWAKHVANTPSTVSNFTRTNCPTSGTGYVGPCNREGHCESYVASEAVWDFAARDLPSPGSGAAWSVVDRLWYLSRGTATSAFSCTTSGTWTSNGCATGSLWNTMRAADDDDGNLANGTPHSCNLYAAFNRHGIACTTDPGANTCFSGCTSPATPTVTATPGNSQVALSWTSSGAGVVYDVYRNEVGCGSGFLRIATAVATTSYTDLAVANGTVYYYQVTAYPSGNGACAGAPSVCVNATPTPCPAIAAPTGVAAAVTATNQITVSFNDSATGSVTSYEVYRATVTGGPYTLLGTVTDTGAGPYAYVDNTVSGGTTYFYVVKALAPGGCSSANSTEASATATGECTLLPTFAGLQTVTALGGGQGCGLRLAWNAGTTNCGGALTYSVYRSTTSGFTPGPANLLASCLAGTAYDDTTMALDTTAYYVVRAEDAGAAGAGACNGGNVEANTTQKSGFVSSTAGSATLYSNGFETGSGLADWVAGTFSGGDNADDWRGIQTCAAHGGTKIFRFGGNCTELLGRTTPSNDFTFAQPNGAGGIVCRSGRPRCGSISGTAGASRPAGTAPCSRCRSTAPTTRMVPAAAILANAYNGTTVNGAGYPAWTNAQATFVNTTVNLDAGLRRCRRSERLRRTDRADRLHRLLG